MATCTATCDDARWVQTRHRAGGLAACLHGRTRSVGASAASRRFASPGCPCAGALRPPSTCSAQCDHDPRLPPDSAGLALAPVAAPAGGRPASSSSSSSTSSSDPPGLRHCPACVTTARRSSRRHLQHCATLQWYQHTAALPCFLSYPSPFFSRGCSGAAVLFIPCVSALLQGRFASVLAACV